jgi:hypothetical protein
MNGRLQERFASKEVAQIDRQIAAAEIRVAIAEAPPTATAACRHQSARMDCRLFERLDAATTDLGDNKQAFTFAA